MLIESRLNRLKNKTEEKMTVADFDKEAFEKEERRQKELEESRKRTDMTGQISNIIGSTQTHEIDHGLDDLSDEEKLMYT